MAKILGGPSTITDKTVTEKTGKSSAEWYKIIDDWQTEEKKYHTIIQYLQQVYGLNHWWANVVTIRYEYERGIRF